MRKSFLDLGLCLSCPLEYTNDMGMNVNLAAMRLFCDVVRCRNFSQAATKNGVSQSAVSQAIQHLETAIGARLIDRAKRPFVLTNEGEAYYGGVCEILHRYEAIEADIRSLKEDMSGTVRVAAIYSVGLYEMHACMQDFMARYPKARVRLHYLLPDRIYDAVSEDDVDLGIVSYPVGTRELSAIPLIAEPMVLVCQPGHHLARRERVRFNELHGENFIGFERTLTISRELDRHMRERHIVVRKVMEFDNVETIKQAVEIGAGVSILPLVTVRKEVAAETMAAVPFADEKLERPIGVIHRTRKAFAPVVKRFIESLQTVLAHANTPDAH